MMKHLLLYLSLIVLHCGGIHAQSLIDKELERVACGALANEISNIPEKYLRYAGVVVTEVSTGNVVANVSLFYKDGEFVKNPHGNTLPLPCALGRSVQYLSLMMAGTDPYMIIDTGNGSYVDSDGYRIEDSNFSRGGFGILDLKRGYSSGSDIAILKACEKVFNKDMKKYAEAINKSGILFGNKVTAEYGSLRSHDLLGYSSPMSLLQMVAWCNAVAGGKLLIRMDEKDSVTPYDSISSKEARDSLCSAMRESVVRGVARKMNSEYVHVVGFTNLSPMSADGYKGQFAAAIMPYGDSHNKPKYTVGVYILRYWGKGASNPSNCALKIIDWLAFNRIPYSILNECETIKHKEGWIHPAAR